MGLATAEEAKLVAEMAARYPEVKEELRAIEESMENFDRKNAVEPPAHLKAKILSQVGGSESAFVRRENAGGKVIPLNGEMKQNNFYRYAAGVALVLLIGSVAYVFSLSSQLSETQGQVAALEADLRESKTTDSLVTIMEQQMLAVQDELTTARNDLRLLKSPSMKSIELKGMEVAPDARAMAYANTTTGAVYLEIMNLPAAPDGMQYQFWGIVNGKPVDAGMIPVSGADGIHPMTVVPNAVAYAISLEPAGGSDQPTGKIYVMGNS